MKKIFFREDDLRITGDRGVRMEWYVCGIVFLALFLGRDAFGGNGSDEGPFLIPWPQEVKRVQGGSFVLGKEGELDFEVLSLGQGFFQEAEDLINGAARSKGFKRNARQDGVRILLPDYCPGSERLLRCQDFSLLLDESDVSVLSKSDQAYLIRMTPGNPSEIWIVGASPLGAYYGACTLIQLIEKDGQGQLVIRPVSIRDYPDTPYRMSADWVLGLDWHGNGYDWGDGLEAFLERCKRQIDFCSRHKVNLIRFLGGTILPGAEYSEFRYEMLKNFAPELNRYARSKGICLQYSFSDWGMDYGEFGLNYPEPWVLNRKSYPDGPAYSCLMGTAGDCFSNEDLTGMIAERIQRFVREIEPGSIYLHHLDLDGSSQWPVYWAQKRCARCRERWPDDDWTSSKGLAGAMAGFMNRIISEVRAVENPESGYRAGRDLQVVFASPYAGQDPDAYWDQYIQFYQHVGRLLIDKHNIQFVTREQYKRWDNRDFRTIELARAMEEVGWRNAIFMFAIQGGGYWYGDRMFNTSPVFSNIWNGAGTLYHFNGHVHSEAQVLANVNYAWNHHAPGWVDLSGLEGREVQREAFRYIPQQSDFPKYSEYLYGAFLDEACLRLYGGKAGPILAAMFRLEPDIGAVVPHVIPMARKRSNPSYNWQRQSERNRQALKLVLEAADVCDNAEGEKSIEHLAGCLAVSAKICDLYSGLYLSGTEPEDFYRQADELTMRLERDYSFLQTEPDGGDIGYWKPMIAWARRQRGLVCRKNTLPIAKYSRVRASSSQEEYPAVSVFTSDPAGRQWGHDGGWQDNTAYLFPDRLEFQFDPPQPIAGMVIYTLADDWKNLEAVDSQPMFSKYGITGLDVEVKIQEKEWEVVRNIRGNRNVKMDVEVNRTVDRIRLNVFETADGCYSRVVHVDFY